MTIVIERTFSQVPSPPPLNTRSFKSLKQRLVKMRERQAKRSEQFGPAGQFLDRVRRRQYTWINTRQSWIKSKLRWFTGAEETRLHMETQLDVHMGAWSVDTKKGKDRGDRFIADEYSNKLDHKALRALTTTGVHEMPTYQAPVIPEVPYDSVYHGFSDQMISIERDSSEADEKIWRTQPEEEPSIWLIDPNAPRVVEDQVFSAAPEPAADEPVAAISSIADHSYRDHSGDDSVSAAAVSDSFMYDQSPHDLGSADEEARALAIDTAGAPGTGFVLVTPAQATDAYMHSQLSASTSHDTGEVPIWAPAKNTVKKTTASLPFVEPKLDRAQQEKAASEKAQPGENKNRQPESQAKPAKVKGSQASKNRLSRPTKKPTGQAQPKKRLPRVLQTRSGFVLKPRQQGPVKRSQVLSKPRLDDASKQAQGQAAIVDPLLTETSDSAMMSPQS